MREALKYTFLKNSISDYLIAFGIFAVGIVLVKLLRSTVLKKVKRFTTKTENNLDDSIVNGIDKFLIPILYYFSAYIGLSYLTLSKKVETVIAITTTVVVTYFVIRLISSTILALLQTYVSRQEKGQEKVKQLGGIMLLINIFIWIVGLIFLIDNMGYNVTTVITGLGIGGIAIALAAQNILSDLFNYFVIFFDRPFEIGDFIIIDDKMGTVDYIGIKTTRVKSLTGEQLVFSTVTLPTPGFIITREWKDAG